MSIDRELDEIRVLDRQGKREAALKRLQELIDRHPNEARLWSLQGSLYGRSKKFAEAINSLDTAITLSPQQGTFYFLRGNYQFTLGNSSKAVSDYSLALVNDNYNDLTFTQELYFHRAEAYIQIGEMQKARADLTHVPDDYQSRTFELRTKSNLVSDCKKIEENR